MSGASVAPVTNDVRGLAFRWSVRVFDRLPARERVCNRHLRPREATMSRKPEVQTDLTGQWHAMGYVS